MNVKIRFGRKRSEKKGLNYFLETKKESWPAFGQETRYHYNFNIKFLKKPLHHLIKIKKKKPKIMILGAGEGKDLNLFKEDLNRLKINPAIDVFSLTKSINPEILKKTVNNDFSKNKAIESIDPIIDKSLISKIKSK